MTAKGKAATGRLTTTQARALAALAQCAPDPGTLGGSPYAERTATALKERGLVRASGGGYVLTESGREAHAAIERGRARTAAPRSGDLPAPVDGVPHPCHEWIALLDRRGMTQSDAAKSMGVSPMAANRMLSGKTVPSARMTVAFAHALGLSPRRLWAGVSAYALAVALSEADDPQGA